MANCKECGTELQIRRLKAGGEAYYCPNCKKGFKIHPEITDEEILKVAKEEPKPEKCKICGTELQIRKLKAGGEAFFCPHCKKGFKIQPEQVKPKIIYSAVGNVVQSRHSEFTGVAFGYFGYSLLTAIIGTLTLGIAIPWCICMVMNWEAENSIIDGKRCWFDGSGGELFGKYILWWLLSIVTLGIFALAIPGKMKQYQVEHTHIG